MHAALGRGPIDGTIAVSYREISSRGHSLGITLRRFLLFLDLLQLGTSLIVLRKDFGMWPLIRQIVDLNLFLGPCQAVNSKNRCIYVFRH